MPQNGEELLDDAGYRAVIDGIAKEDLLFGEGRSKHPNKPAAIETHVAPSQAVDPRAQAGVCGRVSRQTRGHRGRQKADRGVRASSRILPSAGSTSCASATCRRRRDNARRARSSCGSGGVAGQSGRLAVAALRQNAHRGRFPTFRCAAPAPRRNCEIAQTVGIAGRRCRPISFGTIPNRPGDRQNTKANCEPRLFLETPRHGAQSRHARRQIRPGEEPDFRHRLPGDRPPLPDAEGARPPRRPQYRGLRHRLSRLAARHARPAIHPRAALARQVRHQVPGRHQRGHRRHRALGHAAGGAARRRQVRWRVRPLVRQGPGRRPHRRRVPPRQFRRHLQARRRAGADGRRPHRRILHHRAPVRISLHRRDDPDPEPGGRAGDSRLRPLRLGDVALLRHLGRRSNACTRRWSRPP